MPVRGPLLPQKPCYQQLKSCTTSIGRGDFAQQNHNDICPSTSPDSDALYVLRRKSIVGNRRRGDSAFTTETGGQAIGRAEDEPFRGVLARPNRSRSCFGLARATNERIPVSSADRERWDDDLGRRCAVPQATMKMAFGQKDVWIPMPRGRGDESRKS